MRPIPPTPAAMVALLVATAACGGAGSKRLQGTWRGLRSDGVGAGATVAANAFAMAMQLDISGDGITVTTPRERQTGHYKVVREDKTAVIIMTDKDGPNDPQTFTFVDDKTIRWSVVDGASIVFQRQ